MGLGSMHNEWADCSTDYVAKNNEQRLTQLGRACIVLQRIDHLSGFPSENDINHLLQTLVNIIHHELGYHNCQIFLTNEDSTHLEFRSGAGFLLIQKTQAHSLRSWRPSLDPEYTQGLVGWAGVHRQVLNVPNVLDDNRYYSGTIPTSTRSELTVPLIFNNTLVGVLDLQSYDINAFDQLDVEMVSFFANQAAFLVHSAHLAQQTVRRLEDINILASTGTGINSAMSVPEIGQIVLHNMLTALHAYSGHILTFDKNNHLLQSLTNVNLPKSFEGLTSESLVIKQVLEDCQPIFASDIDELENTPAVVAAIREGGVRSCACLPLKVREEVLGILFINYQQIHNFSENEKHLINVFAEQTAAALLNARISDRERTARRFAESLARSSRLISSQVDLEDILHTIINEVVEVMELPSCTIALLDEGSEDITRIARVGVYPETNNFFKVGIGFLGTVAATGQIWNEYDVAVLPDFAHNVVRMREGWHGSLGVPIRCGESVIGVLVVHDTKPREFNNDEVAYLEGLTDQAAISVTNATNFQALRRERDMYQALLENATDPIFLLDAASCCILDANQQATICTGYSYSELMGQAVSQLYPDEEQAKIELLQSPDEQNATVVENIQVLRKDGSRFPASYSARQVQVGTEKIIIQIVRDMSERWAMEQQLVRNEQLRVLGQLASGVAHDFNNLLTGILGVSELMLNGVNDNDDQRLLKMIRQSALDGAHMVKRVQMLGPKQTGEFSHVELNSVVQDVVELTRSRWHGEAQQRGIRVEVKLDLGEIPAINGNASELREVITNLVLNAADAMPRGGKLCLQTIYRPRDCGAEVQLVIEDTGIGMSEATLGHLFEPFYTTKAKDGHGLGLSVSNSIIARHGGTIEVYSQLGSGSRFTIKLPTAEVNPQTVEEEKQPSVPARRVLIVDDEPNLLYILTRFLETDQHHVTSTTSGQEAIRLFKEQPDAFDAIFTDLSIADMSGWEVARQVQILKPELPVVLVTGWGADLDPEKLRQCKIAQVVNKPYRFEDVQSVMRHLFKS